MFLEICGIRQLSSCVKSESQTESLRPCPPMQAMVRSLIPYIQRFLYHHDELADVYSDLIDNNIGEKIKRLCFRQVRESHFVGLERLVVLGQFCAGASFELFSPSPSRI